MSFSVGDRLAGRFEIRAVIGDLPTGALYQVYDEQIGVEVALRVISSELLTDESERRAFLPKAARVKALQHPNLLRLYDVLVGDALVYLVMQWAPGQRLSRRLGAADRGALLSPFEARGIVRAVASGMAHAHQHGVVLGSVRPDTVILYPDGLKLTNIGLAPALPRERYLSAMDKAGALDDIAPEVRAGKEPDVLADLYALGRLTQSLLARSDPQALLDAGQLLLRALAEDPTQRPRDAEAFARELEAALRGPIAPVTGQAPAVPTGKDTERVEKLPPASTIEPSPFPDLPSRELVLESHKTIAEQVTHQMMKRGPASLELDPGEMVEVVPANDGSETQAIPRMDDLGATPEITDVGHRSPLRTEDPPPEWIPPSDPLFVPPPPAPVAAVALAPLEDDSATREIPRLEPQEPLTLARTVAEPILELHATPHSRSPMIALVILLLAALGVGALGMLVLRITHPRESAPPAASTPVATSTPVAPSTPVATPLPSLTATHGCALGLAEVGTPHPYCIDLYEYPGGHTVPRTHVSFSAARQICESRGLRMCTDTEWEQACRGPAQASYPYGSSYDAARCNTVGKPGSVIKETGSDSRCRSAAGVYDMSGNVAEWSASGAQRGGSARTAPALARCSHAVRGVPLTGSDDVGFRCCGDYR